jgi:hypothetical protein
MDAHNSRLNIYCKGENCPHDEQRDTAPDSHGFQILPQSMREAALTVLILSSTVLPKVLMSEVLLSEVLLSEVLLSEVLLSEAECSGEKVAPSCLPVMRRNVALVCAVEQGIGVTVTSLERVQLQNGQPGERLEKYDLHDAAKSWG